MKGGNAACKTSKKAVQGGGAGRHFEEAKATVKLRKRKERQESVGSLSQDKKVIRSNSEERPPYQARADGMRRVSSSGDFPRQNGAEEAPEPTRCEDYDRTRSVERFARAHQPRLPKKSSGKRNKPRAHSKTKTKSDNNQPEPEGENEKVVPPGTASLRFLDLGPMRAERSPSPTRPSTWPSLDFASLYDDAEPLVSQPAGHVTDDMETMPGQLIASNKMASSPRNSIIATRRIYLDPNVPQAQSNVAKTSANPIDERIDQLARLIAGCKKKIAACDDATDGPNPAARKLHAELNKLKRERRNLTEITGRYCRRKTAPDGLEETLREIETRLQLTRATASRDLDLDHLTQSQLIEQKVATQKALLFLESVHGRPQTKHDRDLVRPFYDRYRLLKQLIVKSNAAVTGGELATIDENETMHFVTSTSSESATAPPPKATATPPPDNVQTLRKPELIEQLRIVKEEKRRLRAQIKEFEKRAQDSLGRTPTREDRKPAEDLYVAYKRVKGRLRLIEVLVGKC